MAFGLELTGDAAAPVPTCPGWSVADLVFHTGRVYRWIGHVVGTRATEPSLPCDINTALPAEPDRYGDWLVEGASELTGALREAGPDAGCWTWTPDRRASWWARRGLHETVVHRADLAMTAGREPSLDPADAADGIDELLAYLPYGRRTSQSVAELPAGGERLHLHATDADGEWMITLTPDGMRAERGHGKGDVAVRGPVATLLLLGYGRVSPADPRLQIFGDPGLLATWLAKTQL